MEKTPEIHSPPNQPLYPEDSSLLGEMLLHSIVQERKGERATISFRDIERKSLEALAYLALEGCVTDSQLESALGAAGPAIGRLVRLFATMSPQQVERLCGAQQRTEEGSSRLSQANERAHHILSVDKDLEATRRVLADAVCSQTHRMTADAGLDYWRELPFSRGVLNKLTATLLGDRLCDSGAAALSASWDAAFSEGA